MKLTVGPKLPPESQTMFVFPSTDVCHCCSKIGSCKPTSSALSNSPTPMDPRHIGQVPAEVDTFAKLAASAGGNICEVGELRADSE